MSSFNPPFEIHVHGDIPLRDEVDYPSIQEALRPLWQYTGAKTLVEAAPSFYEDEPGIRFDAKEHLLQICWSVEGDDDFRHALDEVCMGLNEIAAAGAALEVSFYDLEFDEEEAPLSVITAATDGCDSSTSAVVAVRDAVGILSSSVIVTGCRCGSLIVAPDALTKDTLNCSGDS